MIRGKNNQRYSGYCELGQRHCPMLVIYQNEMRCMQNTEAEGNRIQIMSSCPRKEALKRRHAQRGYHAYIYVREGGMD